MPEIAADGHTLTIDSTEITFNYEIGDFIEIDGIVVVRLQIPPEEVHNRNVLGIDQNGAECWRIPESPHGTAEDNPYMSLYLREGDLWVGNWTGWRYRVDSETGELLEQKFTK